MKAAASFVAMTTPNQIVLATDFSPSAMAAVPVAGKFAQIFDAKVTLLHIFQYAPKHRYKVPVEWMVEIIRRDVRCKLLEAKAILHESGAETEVAVLEDGIPSQQILGFLQSCEAPLLLMGTHAVGGMDRFILGSTAEEVVRQARCPVVTVGPHVSSSAPDNVLFREVLYATDFGVSSLAAVPFVELLRQSAQSHLRVLHVSADRTSDSGEEKKQFDAVRTILKAMGDEEYITLHGTNVSQAVVNEAERDRADLVILGVKRASAFASHAPPKIAFQIIAASPCAVLTVSS
jgi:nucleotide-binding universal stress UspA family protein